MSIKFLCMYTNPTLVQFSAYLELFHHRPGDIGCLRDFADSVLSKFPPIGLRPFLEPLVFMLLQRSTEILVFGSVLELKDRFWMSETMR